MGKNVSNKYSQNIFDSAKKSTVDPIKNCFKKSNSQQQKQLMI